MIMLMPNGGQVAFEDSAVLNVALFESMHRDYNLPEQNYDEIVTAFKHIRE